MLPTLANVDTATLSSPVPTPMEGVTASPTQTYGAPAWARHRFMLAYPTAQAAIPSPTISTANGATCPANASRMASV